MTPQRLAILRRALDRRQPDLTLLAENTQKTHNIAALLRTCDAVGVSELHAVADEPVRRHHMVSAGSHKRVPVIRHASESDALAQLRSNGLRLLAAHLSPSAVDFREVDYTQPCAIIVGSELFGVSATAAQLADQHIRIPMKGLVESLNVSVAAALVLYEALRQRERAGLYDRCRLDRQTYDRLLFEWGYPRIAHRCRQLGVPYPRLADDGSIVENTFTLRTGDLPHA
ncbi:MAG: tRNA (guanosine(18)-2'-O)-methyltransferase TrmH [Gammaproteobacteria bacterium]|nr:tRNA (guanosine(18)-2'-O)-methyltransferase TrmH [Gammaproteobacteria bacterium]